MVVDDLYVGGELCSGRKMRWGSIVSQNCTRVFLRCEQRLAVEEIVLLLLYAISPKWPMRDYQCKLMCLFAAKTNTVIITDTLVFNRPSYSGRAFPL